MSKFIANLIHSGDKALATGKKLGVADERGRYDLPLNKGGGTGFLILLVALMTFLATMALSMSFVLDGMTERWSSGIENHMTIEIPTEDSGGLVRTRDDLRLLSNNISEALAAKTDLIDSHKIMSESDIIDLLSPWLGDNISADNIPLPSLIEVKVMPDVDDLPAKTEALKTELEAIVPNVHVDTHEEWLADLVRFTGSLNFVALLVILLIGFTTIAAVAGAIHARIAVHKREVELLHLMGARDAYINQQFQRHALILCLKGSIIGLLCAIATMIIMRIVIGGEGSQLMPSLSISIPHILILLSLPAFSALIGSMTARFTVMRSLSRMP